MSVSQSSKSCRVEVDSFPWPTPLSLASERWKQAQRPSLGAEVAKSVLISLLDRKREEFATRVTDAILGEMADSHFGKEELRTTAATGWVDMLIDALTTGSCVRWPATGLSSPAYAWKMGLNTIEVVQAGLIMIEVYSQIIRENCPPGSAIAEACLTEMHRCSRKIFSAMVADYFAETKRQIGDKLASRILVELKVLRQLEAGQEAEARQPASDEWIHVLTRRELDVLKRVAEGHSNKEIADALCVMEGTVKLHLRSIMEKLQVTNRVQAAVLAVKAGLTGQLGGGD